MGDDRVPVGCAVAEISHLVALVRGLCHKSWTLHFKWFKQKWDLLEGY